MRGREGEDGGPQTVGFGLGFTTFYPHASFPLQSPDLVLDPSASLWAAQILPEPPRG